jgi:hypothetical protein
MTDCRAAARNQSRLALLCARRERPRHRRAAEKCDELAPFHRPMPPVLSTEGYHTWRGETATLRDLDLAYDRSGSSATEPVRATPPWMSRFAPKANNKRTISADPLSARAALNAGSNHLVGDVAYVAFAQQPAEIGIVPTLRPAGTARSRIQSSRGV